MAARMRTSVERLQGPVYLWAMSAQPETSILAQAPADARARLAAWVTGRGLPAYRLEQLVRRLWVAPVEAWSDATELPQALRSELDAAFPLLRLDPVTIQQSQDGTTSISGACTTGR